tara:strand:+ start:24 stop:767 length:744 start_codon:yes stop_codon:yes gene_type:complete
MFQNSSFNELPVVIKNLLIINGLLFLASISLDSYGVNLDRLLALHQFQSNNFLPIQLISHFFMHANFNHLFWNMFALWMFGKVLENIWGSKRFLIYYFITAIGAAIIHIIFCQFQIFEISSKLDSNLISQVIYAEPNTPIRETIKEAELLNMKKLYSLINTPTVGASGAIFGILLAFGMLFPNTLLYVFFAIPIKAKYFVFFYGIIELYLGFINNPNDNVAHFAHLGGMLFGYILLKYWQKNKNHFY